MEKNYDYLIVGAGLYGAMFAHQANLAGKRCLVIDRRSHLGGNLYCHSVDGIQVHQYGPHIFHTNNKAVWDFVNKIVPFNRYTNSPLANYKGRLYNLPFNMNTFHQMWGVVTPEEALKKINEQRSEALELMKAEGIHEPRNLEEQALVLIGRDIYEKLIKGYTEKQWGRPCNELPAFIIRRLPVRFVYDNNYFNDAFQGIPIGGYNKLIDGLLKDVDTLTNVDFSVERKKTSSVFELFGSNFKKVLFTGPIDEYFDYQYGKLEYRTVRFETEDLPIANFQGNAVINYTDRQVPYTRIIEHKHFDMFGPNVEACPHTIISREYSVEWQEGLEPYYPVNDERNSQIYKKYENLAANETNVLFGGRLAEYKYYDMAPILEKIMNISAF